MAERVLTQRELNRALLARQLLLQRSRLPLGRALEQVAGLQAQYAPAAYIGLWSRVERFELRDLTRALQRKRAIQGTLMRNTIHVVSPRDYWLFSEGVGPSRERWWLRTHGREHGAVHPRLLDGRKRHGHVVEAERPLLERGQEGAEEVARRVERPRVEHREVERRADGERQDEHRREQPSPERPDERRQEGERADPERRLAGARTLFEPEPADRHE